MDYSQEFEMSRFSENGINHFQSIEIKQLDNVNLKNCVVGQLNIMDLTSSIEIESCIIAKLYIHPGSKNIVLTNSWVGRLELSFKSVNTLEIFGGSIRSIDCPPPDAEHNR